VKLSLLAALLSGLSFGIVEGAPAETSTLLDLNDVLGSNIDEVPDSPEFVTPPAGSYRLGLKDAKAEQYKTTDKETKEEVQKVRLKLIYTVMATKELADAEEAPVANGSLFSEQFMTNQDGLSFFKRQAKNVLGEEVIKGATIGDILKELGSGTHTFDADVRVKSSAGKDASGNKKVYTNVQVRIKPGTGQEPQL
jgi:hypothetical protein